MWIPDPTFKNSYKDSIKNIIKDNIKNKIKCIKCNDLNTMGCDLIVIFLGDCYRLGEGSEQKMSQIVEKVQKGGGRSEPKSKKSKFQM